MSFVHLHLLLNHIPVVGLIGVVLLLSIAVFGKSPEMTRVALAFLVALGVITVVVTLTGEPTEEVVENLAGVSEVMIERHEDTARVAALAMYVLGGAALGALLYFRRSVLPRALTSALLAASVMVAVLMGLTANSGGQIRHSEIRESTTVDLREIDDR